MTAIRNYHVQESNTKLEVLFLQSNWLRMNYQTWQRIKSLLCNQEYCINLEYITMILLKHENTNLLIHDRTLLLTINNNSELDY